MYSGWGRKGDVSTVGTKLDVARAPTPLRQGRGGLAIINTALTYIKECDTLSTLGLLNPWNKPFHVIVYTGWRKMMVKTNKRWVWAIALAPVLGGLVGFALSIILSPSDMRFWKWRADIVPLMGYCCLIQGCLAIWFLIRRFWRHCLMMVGLFVFLAFLTYLALLGSGPDVETIRAKAASVTGCQPSGLVCLGGRLSRESVVLLKPENGFEPSENFTPIPADDRETYRMLEGTLEWLKVSGAPGSRLSAFRCRLEFDTLFAVHRGGGWWLLFYGNVTM